MHDIVVDLFDLSPQNVHGNFQIITLTRIRMVVDHTHSQKQTTRLESVVLVILYQIIYLRVMLTTMLLELIWWNLG